MIADLLRAFVEAAVVEARTVTKLMERGGNLYWRATGGDMIPMTSGAHNLEIEHR